MIGIEAKLGQAADALLLLPSNAACSTRIELSRWDGYTDEDPRNYVMI
jgi:hypothetical protein